MRSSIHVSTHVLLLVVCLALLVDVGFGRFTIPPPKSSVDDHVAHPKAVSRLWVYIGLPWTPRAAPPPPLPLTPAAPKQQPPKVPAPPTWKPPTPEDYQKCFSSLAAVDRCLADIVAAFFTGDYRHIGPDCCAAVVGIDDNCYGNTFDNFNHRYYAPALRQNCAQRSPPKAPSKA